MFGKYMRKYVTDVDILVSTFASEYEQAQITIFVVYVIYILERTCT